MKGKEKRGYVALDLFIVVRGQECNIFLSFLNVSGKPVPLTLQIIMLDKS